MRAPQPASRRSRTALSSKGVALRLVIAIAAALALSACDSKPKEPPPDILKGHRDQMERAKGVEQGLDDAAKKRMEEADRQSK